MKNYISTPNLGLKIKLNEHFTIYNLDEFISSLLNCKTEEKNDNLYLPDKKNVIRKIHSVRLNIIFCKKIIFKLRTNKKLRSNFLLVVLTFQTESNRMGCINRDENSVNNMIKIVNYYLLYKDRPEKFKRSFILRIEDK